MKAVSVLGSRGTRRAVRILTLSLLLGATGSPLVAAEPQPGDTLNQENWQQAKSLLPEGMLPRFADGSYQAQIVSPPTTMTWGSAFTSASAANADKFEVDADGALVVKGTKTVPPFLYGTPFPRIDPTDPQAAAKVIYNFSYTLMQADDVDRSSVLHWVVPKEVQNQVEFRTQLLFQGARFSGPITNPDATLRKGIISGITPAEIFGVMILEWVYLDPKKWNSLWGYVPELRRVRQLPPFNGSDSLFGSDLAHDDPYLFSGKVQYFTWKLIGTQDALVPYSPASPQFLVREDSGYSLEEPKEPIVMGWEKAGWPGKAWWPTTLRLMKRPVWVIEATAKDAQYEYGRQVLWIDRELHVAYYKEAYNRAGQLWRMLLNSVTVVRTPEGDFSLAQPDLTLSVDELQQRATVELPAKKNRPTRFNVGLQDVEFTSTKLIERGK
ncbi:MAG: DUF1329 domain-containing protein [Deltaproteobacteria bacterium]|nr:DUF1329 domain-containing protein [Deltaproteobacteria bacterium]